MKDKVIIITGASSGIGKALAIECAWRHAKLSLGARNIPELEHLAAQLSANGVEVLVTPVDVAKEEDCRNLVTRTLERFGRVDVLINNAGISMRALFEEVDLDVLRRVMDTNFWGTVYCSKFALPHLLLSRGRIFFYLEVPWWAYHPLQATADFPAGPATPPPSSRFTDSWRLSVPKT